MHTLLDILDRVGGWLVETLGVTLRYAVVAILAITVIAFIRFVRR